MNEVLQVTSGRPTYTDVIYFKKLILTVKHFNLMNVELICITAEYFKCYLTFK